MWREEIYSTPSFEAKFNASRYSGNHPPQSSQADEDRS